MHAPKDKYGNMVNVGARARLVGLAGQWLEDLPDDEKPDVLSMIGEIFEVEEIDEYGQAWIRKSCLMAMAGSVTRIPSAASHETQVVDAAAA